MITADLKGRAVLVTGGISGIGRAAVELFGRCGARVAVNYLPDDERAEGVLAEHRAAGLDVLAAPGNVSVPGEAERMVAGAVQALGRLDYLINNAGTPVSALPVDIKDLDRLDEAFWQAILSTNLLGPFRCARAAAPALKDWLLRERRIEAQVLTIRDHPYVRIAAQVYNDERDYERLAQAIDEWPS